MDNLPLELVIYIFIFVHPADYMKCCLVCKFWNSLLFNKIKEKWKLYKKDKNKTISPKKLFTFKHNIEKFYIYKDDIITFFNSNLKVYNIFNIECKKWIIYKNLNNIKNIECFDNNIYIFYNFNNILILNNKYNKIKYINNFENCGYFLSEIRLICKLGIIYYSFNKLFFYSFNNNKYIILIYPSGSISELYLDINNILYLKIKNLYYTINLNYTFLIFNIVNYYYYSLDNIIINKDINIIYRYIDFDKYINFLKTLKKVDKDGRFTTIIKNKIIKNILYDINNTLYIY